jgi:hypothetical protein
MNLFFTVQYEKTMRWKKKSKDSPSSRLDTTIRDSLESELSKDDKTNTNQNDFTLNVNENTYIRSLYKTTKYQCQDALKLPSRTKC